MVNSNLFLGSTLRVVPPSGRDKHEVIMLADAFIRQEAILPEAEQTPFTQNIGQLLAQANNTQMSVLQMESQRKEASQAYKRAEEKSAEVAHQVRNLLAARFPHTPELAQAWGLMVRQTGRNAGQILMPKDRQEMHTFLNVYIQKEEAQPVGEQIQQPALSDMVAVRDSLLLQKRNRDNAVRQRVLHNEQLNQLCMQMADDLRRALGYLLLMRYDGKPGRELEQWGFRVVPRTSGSNGEVGSASTTAPDENSVPA